MGWLSDMEFLATSGQIVWNFLTFTGGFVLLTIVTVILMGIAYYREIWKRDHPEPAPPAFPDLLNAEYVGTDFNLMGFNDFVVYRFRLRNASIHKLHIRNDVITGITVALGLDDHPILDPAYIADNLEIHPDRKL